MILSFQMRHDIHVGSYILRQMANIGIAMKQNWNKSNLSMLWSSEPDDYIPQSFADVSVNLSGIAKVNCNRHQGSEMKLSEMIAMTLLLVLTRELISSGLELPTGRQSEVTQRLRPWMEELIMWQIFSLTNSESFSLQITRTSYSYLVDSLKSCSSFLNLRFKEHIFL